MSKNPTLTRPFKKKEWDWWDSLSAKTRQAIEHQTELALSWKKKVNKNTFSFLDPLKFITKDE